MQMVDEKLYIFGGCHAAAALCNKSLFVVLKIESRQQEKWSGTIETQTSHDFSGPRCYATSWVGKSNGKFVLMCGEADRQSARIAGQPNSEFNGYSYDYLWSWDLCERNWRRVHLWKSSLSEVKNVAHLCDILMRSV